MQTKLLRETEVAEQIGMSTHWLRRKRLTGGGIPYLKMSGASTGAGGDKGAVRYAQSSVDAFVASRVRSSTSDQGVATETV